MNTLTIEGIVEKVTFTTMKMDMPFLPLQI